MLVVCANTPDAIAKKSIMIRGLSPNDDPLNSGKVYHANLIKHRFKGHMIVSAMDMLPQSPDTVFLFTGGNSYTKPSILQGSGKHNILWSLGQKKILVLRIFSHLVKYLFPPLCIPVGKIAHAGEQKILWALFLHQPQLIGKKLRLSKVINHVKPADIVSGIAVAATNSTADHQIHVLNTVFNTNSHR